jgi:hypothetical protein
VEGWLTVASRGKGQHIPWHLRKEDGDHYPQEKKLTRRMKSYAEPVWTASDDSENRCATHVRWSELMRFPKFMHTEPTKRMDHIPEMVDI